MQLYSRPASGALASSSQQRKVAPAGRAAPPARRPVAAYAEANGVASKSALKNTPFVTYYFDPLNPENVVEVVAKPAQPTQRSPAGNGYGSNQLAKAEDGKMLVQLQAATQQLEVAKTTIQRLRQFELLYKESKMRAKQMGTEIAMLQTLVADKDAELARQYKRMEKEAQERSGLRTQYTSALEDVRALRQDLEEARQAMLELKNAMPGARKTLGSSASAAGGEHSGGLGGLAYNSSNRLGDAGLGSEARSPAMAASGHHHADHSSGDVLHGLQGLAKQLAEGMELEVGSLFGGGRREHR